LVQGILLPGVSEAARTVSRIRENDFSMLYASARPALTIV
jgi:hypothetical protein